MIKRYFGLFQEVGKALMLPVAILPVAGIFLGLGSAMQDEQIIRILPLLDTKIIFLISEIMKFSGKVIFDNLPLLFAVGVAVGLTRGSGVSAIAAIIGFLIMNQTISVFLGITIDMVLEKNNPNYVFSLGIPTLQTGVFGGIIIGILAASMYNRFYDIKLPSYLGFFAGKRFVPIITAALALIVGIIMTFVWPYVQIGLSMFSANLINANLTISAFIFGVFERALIPFGLHHIFYSPFWFEFGEYVNKSGEIIRGDQRIFFEQLMDNVPLTAGTFMTGKYPFMMFGLPAAALAMYHEAKKEKKKIVAGLMFSGALTSFLTGITEPIEFTFLFIAPILFIIHTFFAGLSFMIMQILDVKIGMTFSGGFIDFVLFGVIQNKTRWWLVILIGIIYAFIYYFGFRFAIRYFNLKTPGREEDENTTHEINLKKDDIAYNVLNSLGGKDNIKSIDSCITRLRIQVEDINKVDKDNLKKLGGSGTLVIGNNVQAIFGTYSEQLKTRILNIINKENSDINKCDKELFTCPIDGKIINLKEVPDEIFSEEIMGEGFAIAPSDGIVDSPVNGVITSLYPTYHAIGITTIRGVKILIHFGINTVNLKGEGFQVFIKEGQQVKIGQRLMEVDLNKLKEENYCPITPIIFSNIDKEVINLPIGINIDRGTILFDF